ncbi:MAG TPA: M81 family metallopeptidase [Deltaproteobacteria bacterium]|nr:M81 family metallopeptidase [Deltaproteobacteria bacterium]
MKWIIGAFLHETNNFSVVPTDLNAFQAQVFKTGDEIIESALGTKTPISGFIDVMNKRGDRIIPTAAASATPSGLVTKEAYKTVADIILNGVSHHLDSDGILLALHGAMMAEGFDDGEGELLEKIRAIVGPDMPIVAVLDLHSHITRKMLEHATMLVGYQKYPHTDTYERGIEAAELITRIVQEAVSPVYAIEQPPILPPCSTCNTESGLYRSLWEEALRPDRSYQILSTSIFAGFPHADHPDAGMSVLTYAMDQDTAETEVHYLSDILWKRRKEFLYTPTSIPHAVKQAVSCTAKPVVISDMSDNPGGGSANDGVEILKELIRQNVKNAAISAIYDPEVVKIAEVAGIGNDIETTLGAKTDKLHGTPIDIKANVENMTDGRFQYKGPMTHGAWGNLGPTAILNINGSRVIVTSERIQSRDPEIFRACGIEPTEMEILVVKSSVHFRAGFKDIAEKIIVADGPGLTAADLTLLPYKRIRRPMFPIDEI